MNDFPQNFDLETLLTPAEGESRAGVDLRRDDLPQTLYYRLRDARTEARAVERKMERGDPDVSPAQWQQQWRDVRKLATEALGQAKDLEVGCWLTEALLRDSGLSGLTAGVKLMTGFVEGFWDEVYPLPDDEGIATRLAPIAGLNGESGAGTLIQPLQRLPLFTRPDGAALEFWQYERSERIRSGRRRGGAAAAYRRRRHSVRGRGERSRGGRESAFREVARSRYRRGRGVAGIGRRP